MLNHNKNPSRQTVGQRPTVLRPSFEHALGERALNERTLNELPPLPHQIPSKKNIIKTNNGSSIYHLEEIGVRFGNIDAISGINLTINPQDKL
ncbi:MAG: hypothetical protein HQK53_18045, partial [Oligoflexia bacterium]|nr:hypothetical protein [Oligoflexia bacterium]